MVSYGVPLMKSSWAFLLAASGSGEGAFDCGFYRAGSCKSRIRKCLLTSGLVSARHDKSVHFVSALIYWTNVDGGCRSQTPERADCMSWLELRSMHFLQQERAGVASGLAAPSLFYPPRRLSFFINHYRQVAGPCDIEWVCSSAPAVERWELI